MTYLFEKLELKINDHQKWTRFRLFCENWKANSQNQESVLVCTQKDL